MTHELLELMGSLNRKERFFLVGDALGNREFRLGDDFRVRLTKAIGFEVPADAWVAMDFHLSWISGALHMVHHIDRAKWDEPWTNKRSDGSDVVGGNQEDVDLIVGFEKDGIVHLVMIEAKLDSGWTNTQLDSKAKRLGEIFGNDGLRYSGVKPWFVVTSEKRSEGLKADVCPEWMAPGGTLRWMELKANGGRRQLQRVDSMGKQAILRKARRLADGS